jgi:hypothetical protein
MDTHVDTSAFWAAYKALQDNGVTLAQVRAEVSNLVAVAVLDRRTQHGLGYMLQLTQSLDARKPIVEEIAAATPAGYTSITGGALDAAVVAAAAALNGDPTD